MLNGLPETMQLPFLVQSWRLTKVSKCGDDFSKSSANRLVKKDVTKGKSVMYMRNSRGPRTLPCGTLYKKVFFFEIK